MATHRCPECGATHKQAIGQCRLCGAPLDTAVTVRTTAIDKSVAAERFKTRSIAHFVWIGLAVGAAIVIGAFVFGAIESNALDRAWNKMPWVDDDAVTRFDWVDPNEKVIVEVSAIPTENDGDGTFDLGAETLSWVTSAGDTTYYVGYTEGLDFEASDDAVESETRLLLSGAIEDLADQQGGRVVEEGDVFAYQDGAAMDAVLDELNLPGGVAFGTVRMVVTGGELYVVETIDYEAESDLATNFRDSLVILSANPDTTIPTIPENLIESAG
jgi:hypothetical protein